jgi:chromate transporter
MISQKSRTGDVIPLVEATRAWRGPVHLDVPMLSSWDPVAFAITAVALILIFGRKWSTMRTLGVCAALGLLSSLLT